MSVRPYRDIYRRKSRQIHVGNVMVGGDARVFAPGPHAVDRTEEPDRRVNHVRQRDREYGVPARR